MRPIGRSSVSDVNEYSETDPPPTPKARASLIKHEVNECASRLFAHID